MARPGSISRRELAGLAGLLIPVEVEAEGQRLLAGRLHVAPSGGVTLYTGKVEIGQGCRTLLTACVAEEMRIPPGRVTVVMADTDLVPDDGGTYGSLTTPLTVPAVRKAAAAAREALGQGNAELTRPADWKVLGTSLANVNGRAIVTGALRFSSDVRLPGMLAGKAVRPEAYHAELVSFDAAEAQRLAGVQVVREGGFLGVVAPDEMTAAKAAALVRAEWRTKPLIEMPALLEHFRKTSVPPVANLKTRYPPLLEGGSVEKGLMQSARRHQAAYTLPYIAHVPIEPRAAVAEWNAKGLTVHCGTQVPFGVRKQLAGALGIPESQVRVITCDTGTGFGGKHSAEVMLEAARLAKAAGKPVRVAWSREEEFVCSYCRPAGVIDVRSGISAEGAILAWDFHNYNSGPASLPFSYSIPNYCCAFHRSDSPLRQGAYRSLAAAANAFARESHIDELAALAGQDPVEFRLRNLQDPRMREVLQRAAERFGWGKSRQAAGVAINLEKDGYNALMVELEVAARKVRLLRMTMAFDCGAVLNPDNLRNQITGALIMGMGGALFEELLYDRTRVRNNRLSQYRVPRFSDVPPIEVILVDRREVTPAGAGESPITVVAPAIAAALFRATGKRIRALPLERGLE